MDNASNNDAAMMELEVILAEKNVKFDAREERIRCYPHIINICVSHIVKSLGKVDDEVVDNEVNDGGEEGSINDTDKEDEEGYIGDTDEEDEEGYIGDTDDEDEKDDEGGETDKAIVSKYVEEDALLNWFKAVKRDPVNIARKFIRTVRASTQKREQFQMTITLGNQTKAFKDDNGSIVQVKDLQLLHDIKHHWDSLFMMLEHMKELQPVSHCLLSAKDGQLNIDRRSIVI